MRAEYLNAVFPHMGGKPQKYRAKNLLTRRQQEKYNCVYVFIFVPLHKEQIKKSLKPASDTRKPEFTRIEKQESFLKKKKQG